MPNKEMPTLEGLKNTIENAKRVLEEADALTSKERRNLDASQFAVPGKRKLPVDTCSRTKNAAARFNQTEGLTSEEKRTAARKIARRGEKCGFDMSGFKEKFSQYF